MELSDEGTDAADKWERMYYDGEKKKQELLESWSDFSSEQISRQSEVKVITFDLDDTIWKTSSVIDAANNALQEYLDRKGLNQPRQVKDVMKDLFEGNSTRYCPELATNPLAKPDPVLLTLLRKDAISNICIQDNGFSFDDAERFAEESFNLWTNARHAAIPLHLAESVIECLEQIRSIQTATGHPVIVGAITNGNSDPRRVPILESYFDFCINSEDVGMAKPSPEIYKTAVKTASSFPAIKDIFINCNLSCPLDSYMDVVGPWWIHIGDDFLKDVVAAKELGMRTIWSREFIISEEDASMHNESLSKRTVQDLVRDLAKQDVIKMEMGSKDYLESSIKDEFADVSVSKFIQLSEVIMGWHEEGMKSLNRKFDPEDASKSVGFGNLPEYFDITLPSIDPTDNGHTSTSKPTAMSVSQASQSPLKFCIFCGTKLPSVAKFCSSCGEAQ